MSEVNNTVLMQRISQQLQRLEQQGSSEPPGGGGADGRIAKVESDVAHLVADVRDIRVELREIKNQAREDFRVLLWTGGGATIGLALLMAKGFGWL